MKKMILALVAALFTSYGAMAQAEKTDGPKLTSAQRTERQVTRMTNELTLNSAQREQVMVLMAKQNEEMDAVRAASGDDKEGMKGKMRGIKSQTETSLKGILTAEQWEKYENMQAERKARRQDHKGGNAAGK